jgi:DNA-3-methyladenine glycosylase I
MVKRCWETSDPAYNAYHDDEWGRPVLDERGLYERLCLEGFQSGLSWLTILRKRESFRAAFANFDPDAVARFTEREVQRLLADATIVRHRGKIEATIANAHATIALRDTTPLPELMWEYRDRDESAAAELSKRLRKSGFRFVGPTTVYAAMQACGIVNDHLPDCWVRDAVERERAG